MLSFLPMSLQSAFFSFLLQLLYMTFFSLHLERTHGSRTMVHDTNFHGGKLQNEGVLEKHPLSAFGRSYILYTVLFDCIFIIAFYLFLDYLNYYRYHKSLY